MRCGRVWVQVLSITLAIEASYASQRHVCRERGRRAHRQASGKATTRRARPEARRELKDPYSLCEALPHAARRLAASRRPQGHRRQGTAPTHLTARIFLTHQDRNDRVEMYYELYGTGPEKVLLIMGVLPFPPPRLQRQRAHAQLRLRYSMLSLASHRRRAHASASEPPVSHCR